MATELVGYLASLMVAISLTMSNVWRLRWINLVGAALFATYGALVGARPVFVVNTFIACVNVYFLVALATRRDYFAYVDVTGPNVRMVQKFVEFYQDDVRRYFPDFDAGRLAGAHAYFVLRNVMPVGLFVYEPKAGGEIEILLDYVIPDYRDFRNAQFLFGAQEHLAREGYHTWVCRTTVPAHRDYLLAIGFRPVEGSPGTFRRSV